MKDKESRTTINPDVELFQTPDILKILSNQKYNSLWERHSARNVRLNQAYELSPDQRAPLVRQIFEEEHSDSITTLTTISETQEYENWFQKFKVIETVKDGLDPGMLPILYQFNSLPFSSYSSDTGHVIAKTNALMYDDPIPIISFGIPENPTNKEKIIQKNFFNNFDTLCISICNQLKCKPYNILVLRGAKNYDTKGYSVVNSGNYMNFAEIDINLFVPFPELRQQKGREVLISVWQNFHSYINSFLKEKSPPFDLGNGDIFIDKK